MEDQSQLSPAELQARLLLMCSNHGWSASFLNSSASSLQELVLQCIKELAACRAAGQGELAVALADAAVAGGLEHPRLAIHRERARGQQQGGALVRQDRGASTALATPLSQPKRARGFWHWLPGFGGKRKTKPDRPSIAGNAKQIEALCATCRSAGWTPKVLSSDAASRDLPRALLREMRACSEAGEHLLVVRLGRQAASLGMQHQRLKRARREAQAMLNSALGSQLETAIQLRQQGQPAASLALLDAALNAGQRSPWIHDNRARALVDLGRRSEAIALWEQLQGNDDPAVADAAQQMLQLQRTQLLAPLHDTLHQLADEHAWPLRHLGDPASLDLEAYSNTLLQDAIEVRENGHPELSLALLDAALDAGLVSPWLQDNRARALVNLQQLPEAVAIWQQLSQHEDDALRTTAIDMIELFGTQAQRQAVLVEADQLRQAGDPDQAIQLLTNALLGDPQCLEIQSQLQDLLVHRQGGLGSEDDDFSQELEPHRRGLLAFTEVLNILEKRLQNGQDKS